MSTALPLQILIGLSAAYIIWPGGPDPRFDHRMIASAWSSLSKLTWGSSSPSTNPHLSDAKDIYLDEAMPTSKNLETQLGIVYGLAVVLFVLFAALGCLWIGRKVRTMIVDEQVRQSIEKNIPGPVKKMFVPLQNVFGRFVQKGFIPVKKVFGPIILILFSPIGKVLALLNAILDFILAIPETIKNKYLAPFKKLQEEESAKLKAILEEQLVQLRISADGLKTTCGTLDERNDQIQQRLERIVKQIESITEWQRQCEFYFMREPKHAREKKADEAA
ncbi:uncharacterized protein DSM5745_07423 [Aspergillus mulundensis]|uniref:Uncharacterized protein n=1 Tax=Aspergillus mulundensis TaxID=1810919 RepID=A0A3D8Q6T3_9EURO|nr:hypothetical protein DSM5745_11416 [Aspergillus mulundensis]XP_026601471.1 hypothetical protein DSM5745_07423 [Aspergillus mulundensis]RDW57521.1 hypothetical protein DSM5745_11416 [Aspergillus mulundensis]RDW72251.1 hypothetical protein DSM5745_07423 [Aspergillus mulundensis]